MKAQVVYESMFGDGRIIAESIADGLLQAGLDASAIEVGGAATTIPLDLDLLIVGGPNHQFGLSRESTRREAARHSDAGVVSDRIGIREWLTELDHNRGGTKSVSYDTRMGHPKMLTTMDHASHTIAKALRRAGFTSLDKPRHFLVVDMRGPLVDGEPDRARAWGRRLADLLSADAGTDAAPSPDL